MTSAVTDVKAALYELILDTLGGEAEGYFQLPNPYLPEANSDLYLNKGIGIVVGPATRTDLELCSQHRTRFYEIVLVRLVAATENDVQSRESVENAILEDYRKIDVAVDWSDQTLGGLATRVDYVSDSGLEFLSGGNQQFYELRMQVSVLYRETNLTI